MKHSCSENVDNSLPNTLSHIQLALYHLACHTAVSSLSLKILPFVSLLLVMDVSIKFDQPEATYTNGDTVQGSIVLYCKSTITLSKVTVTLSGKSTSVLSGTSGLLLHRKNRESHRVSSSQIRRTSCIQIKLH